MFHSLRILATLAFVLTLGACGFTLRGATPLPFDSLYISVPENSRFGANLRRAVLAASPNTLLSDNPAKAAVSLIELGQSRIQREVSLTPQGRVEEYELILTYTFRLATASGDSLIPDITLSASRDMPYDEQLIMAKQSEADNLFNSMERSLIERLLQRMTAPDVAEAFAAYQRENAAFEPMPAGVTQGR